MVCLSYLNVSQEFSKLLLTHLRMIFSQSRISEHWDLVDRIFQGQMSYVTKCLRCKTKSERPSSYYEIVSAPHGSLRTRCVTFNIVCVCFYDV